MSLSNSTKSKTNRLQKPTALIAGKRRKVVYWQEDLLDNSIIHCKLTGKKEIVVIPRNSVVFP